MNLFYIVLNSFLIITWFDFCNSDFISYETFLYIGQHHFKSIFVSDLVSDSDEYSGIGGSRMKHILKHRM